MLEEMELANQDRTRSRVMIAKTSPLMNTAPSRSCQPIPMAARPKAMKAFSPM